MVEVERIVTVLKPTAAFFAWIAKQPNADKSLTLDSMRSDCTALLIPAFESPEDADSYIEQIYEELFINELDSWCEDDSLWPAPLSYALFCEWFDREHNSMVFDVTDEIDEDEEFEEEEDEAEDDDTDFDEEDEEEEQK